MNSTVSKITTADVEKLAQLARIRISDAEKESVRADIENILGYVSQITASSMSDEKDAPVIRNVMRPDVVTHESGEYTEALLSAAPSREGNYFKVKKILQ